MADPGQTRSRDGSLSSVSPLADDRHYSTVETGRNLDSSVYKLGTPVEGCRLDAVAQVNKGPLTPGCDCKG